jgi:hypothetical protein
MRWRKQEDKFGEMEEKRDFRKRKRSVVSGHGLLGGCGRQRTPFAHSFMLSTYVLLSLITP